MKKNNSKKSNTIDIILFIISLILLSALLIETLDIIEANHDLQEAKYKKDIEEQLKIIKEKLIELNKLED